MVSEADLIFFRIYRVLPGFFVFRVSPRLAFIGLCFHEDVSVGTKGFFQVVFNMNRNPVCFANVKGVINFNADIYSYIVSYSPGLEV